MVVLLESENYNFPNKFLFLSLGTQRICCNGKILSLYNNTKNVSEIFLLLILIKSIVCSPDPEPRVSDGRQDSKRIPPSTQCELSCCAIQQLVSKNHQATEWKTSFQIPKHGYILLLQVLPRLKVRIEAFSLPFPLELPLAFVLGIILACAFIWLVWTKTNLLKAIIAL